MPTTREPAMQEEWEQPGLRVLVVDACPDSTESLGLLLQCLGHEAFTARDGFEAAAAADILAPHAVFLDLSGSRRIGLEASRRIRRLPLARQPKIVALNSPDEAPLASESLAAGCDEHWLKPAGLDNLVEFLAGIAASDRLDVR